MLLKNRLLLLRGGERRERDAHNAQKTFAEINQISSSHSLLVLFTTRNYSTEDLNKFFLECVVSFIWGGLGCET